MTGTLTCAPAAGPVAAAPHETCLRTELDLLACAVVERPARAGRGRLACALAPRPEVRGTRPPSAHTLHERVNRALVAHGLEPVAETYVAADPSPTTAGMRRALADGRPSLFTAGFRVLGEATPSVPRPRSTA